MTFFKEKITLSTPKISDDPFLVIDHTHIHVHDSCWHTWLCLTLNRSAAKGLNQIMNYIRIFYFILGYCSYNYHNNIKNLAEQV